MKKPPSVSQILSAIPEAPALVPDEHPETLQLSALLLDKRIRHTALELEIDRLMQLDDEDATLPGAPVQAVPRRKEQDPFPRATLVAWIFGGLGFWTLAMHALCCP